jgi:hypothetical protein
MSDAPRHPDFEPGNVVALKDGLHSPPVRAAMAAELEPEFNEWLSAVAPYATGPAFELMRQNGIWSTAIVELCGRKLVKALDGGPEMTTRDLEVFLSALRNQREALGELGLTVRTKAELGQTVASTEKTLVDLTAEGRAIRQARNDLGPGDDVA